MKVRKSLGPTESSGAEFSSLRRFPKTPVPDAGMRIATVLGKQIIVFVFVCLLLGGCVKHKNLNKKHSSG